MNLSFSQARMAPVGSFTTPDYIDSPTIDFFSSGGSDGIQTFGNIEQPVSQAAPDQDPDANINGQSVDENELLTDGQIQEVVVMGNQIPWLRRASLYKAVSYRGPSWLTGQENWVYLVVLALAAGAAWWYYKRK